MQQAGTPSRHARGQRWGVVLLSIVLWMLGSQASAAILDSSPNGFTVEHVVQTRLDGAAAYRAVTNDIGAWWSAEHTYTGDSSALYLEAVPGGCFCERFIDGGARHMEVELAWPGRLLRLKGGLGPLQALGAVGTLTFSFETVEAGTLVRMTYRVGGYNPDGLGRWATPVDQVLGQQMQGLERLLASL